MNANNDTVDQVCSLIESIVKKMESLTEVMCDKYSRVLRRPLVETDLDLVTDSDGYVDDEDYDDWLEPADLDTEPAGWTRIVA
jgi:hypothetical protein